MKWRILACERVACSDEPAVTRVASSRLPLARSPARFDALSHRACDRWACRSEREQRAQRPQLAIGTRELGVCGQSEMDGAARLGALAAGQCDKPAQCHVLLDERRGGRGAVGARAEPEST